MRNIYRYVAKNIDSQNFFQDSKIATKQNFKEILLCPELNKIKCEENKYYVEMCNAFLIRVKLFEIKVRIRFILNKYQSLFQTWF